MAYKKRTEKFNWEKLDTMLMFQAGKFLCSTELGVSEDTIEREIKKKYKCGFTEYRARRSEKIVLKLKQKMIQKALDGDNVCLIFVLKNIGGWSDNPEPLQSQYEELEFA
jgi:IS30 family transposase